MSDREKVVEKALRRLTSVFIRKLNGFDIRHDLYGKEQLTWMENERIGAASTNTIAVEELLTALRRRGPDILDILIECLEVEEVANADLIAKIREEYPKTPIVETTPAGPKPHPPIPAENEHEFLGNGEWPYPHSAGASSPPSIPPPPLEGIDNAPKMSYRMISRPRGIGIVINNKVFTCGMKERIGTDRDAESLTRMFIYLGFYTNRYDNLKGKDMHKKLREAGELNHSQSDCLMVAILTHGIKGKLYSTDGDLIPVEDLTRYFDGNNCPSLIGKPKVFILQACRGGRFDYGVESETVDAPDTPPIPDEEMKELMEEQYDKIIEKTLDDNDLTDGGGYKSALPTEADFVLAYATTPGYVSWRNSEYGSWFIKAFVDAIFELSSKEHFMDILVEVNRRVAEEFQSKGRNKQIPGPVTMLTRKLYFRPGMYK